MSRARAALKQTFLDQRCSVESPPTRQADVPLAVAVLSPAFGIEGAAPGCSGSARPSAQQYTLVLLRTVSLGHAGTRFCTSIRKGRSHERCSGLAALSICESMLLSMTDTGVIDDDEAKAILEDAARRTGNAAGGWMALARIIERRCDHRGDHHRRQLGAPSPKRQRGAVPPGENVDGL